ncbi:hypothetical protein HYH03_013516 [Edaphochlamys debaryana]|uniref:EGF-like domain-containing protein n=1 Tax=Edaphochlamys debaryana TaxID=47281 RepID=A0A835XN47_9CHLO|nr:hypothetical protein HYH03_013516 [Edaphochlamys debaryana]|eukprot:KAG2487937.1 hypothetical protein HYH03_013516 [Edaphochlamys debaryana]
MALLFLRHASPCVTSNPCAPDDPNAECIVSALGGSAVCVCKAGYSRVNGQGPCISTFLVSPPAGAACPKAPTASCVTVPNRCALYDMLPTAVVPWAPLTNRAVCSICSYCAELRMSSWPTFGLYGGALGCSSGYGFLWYLRTSRADPAIRLTLNNDGSFSLWSLSETEIRSSDDRAMAAIKVYGYYGDSYNYPQHQGVANGPFTMGVMALCDPSSNFCPSDPNAPCVVTTEGVRPCSTATCKPGYGRLRDTGICVSECC